MAQYVYTMNRVGKLIPPKRQILKDISLSFFPGAKIGVLGLNGAGKSTLLRIMAGVDREIEGEAVPMPGLNVGFLPQEPALDPKQTVRQAVEEGMSNVLGAQKRLDEVYAAYADEGADFDALAAEQAKLEAIIAASGADSGVQMEIAADALRLPPWDAKIAMLSGGEKRRVALCRLLLSKPDMLLLDEPTNHLDAESVDWLEQFLQKFPGTVVAVTHDRYFLDNAAEWILELDRGYGIPWKGNYSSWLEQKEAAARDRIEAGGRANQGDEAGARVGAAEREGAAGQEQGAHRAFQRARVLRAPEAQRDLRDLHPGRRAARQRGDRVQGRVEGLRRSAADRRPLLQGSTRRDRRRDRTERRGQDDALQAHHRQGEARFRGRDHRPHGAARGRRPDPRGAAERQDRLGGDQQRPGHPDRRAASRCLRARTSAASTSRGPDQQKNVGQLSGGERGRLHLAATLLQGGNVLLLDEPSNDLDVETLRALEEALLEFAGSVMVISHDRWFLDRIATHILAAEDDSKWVFFEGNYREYENDKIRRLGEDGARPHRPRYKPLMH